mgnify:CR=1 FL=1
MKRNVIVKCPVCGIEAWRHESDYDYSYYVTKCGHDDFRVNRTTGKIVNEQELENENNIKAGK